VERLKVKTYQPLEKGKNPMHSVYYPFVKLSKIMPEMILFL
jgi:hypothetical protein